MIEALKFAKNAVGTAKLNSLYTHYKIENNSLFAYNGTIAIRTPIACDLDVQPQAELFTKAITACKETVALSTTKGGKLTVKSGSFKAHIPCTIEQFPQVEPFGTFIDVNEELLKAIDELIPFVSTFEAQQWANGILFRGNSAYATNNVIAVERYLGYDLPIEFNLPVTTAKTLIKLKKQPKKIRVSDNSVTFYFDHDTWLWSCLYVTKWPDISQFFNVESNQKELPNDFFNTLETLQAMTDAQDKVFLNPGVVSTSLLDDEGAHIKCEIDQTGCYRLQQLLLLKDRIKTIDLSKYPEPALFYSDKLRGVITGVRNV